MTERTWWVRQPDGNTIDGPWPTSRVLALVEQDPNGKAVMLKPSDREAEWVSADQWLAVVERPPVTPPKPRSRILLAVGVGVSIFFILCFSLIVLGIVFASSSDSSARKSPSSGDLQKWAERAPRNSDTPTVSRDQSPGDRAFSKMMEIYRNFDRAAKAGDQFNTLAMLQAHKVQAAQGLEFLTESEAKTVRTGSDFQFRKRVPGVLVPGETGAAEGNAYDTIVPSLDADRCVTLAKAWQKSDQAKKLAEFGFVKMRCGAEEWQLAGPKTTPPAAK